LGEIVTAVPSVVAVKNIQHPTMNFKPKMTRNLDNITIIVIHEGGTLFDGNCILSLKKLGSHFGFFKLIINFFLLDPPSF
jgi:hypothetical protein